MMSYMGLNEDEVCDLEVVRSNVCHRAPWLEVVKSIVQVRERG